MKRLVAIIVGTVVLSVGTAGASSPPPLPTPLTTEQLVAALPTEGDWPPGWSSTGGSPDTEFVREFGNGIGLCGGINEHARAWESGVAAYAGSPDVAADDQRTYADVRLYAFPDEVAAGSFMGSTASQAVVCAAGEDYTLPESEFDMYLSSDDQTLENATWQIVGTVSLGSVEVDADEAFFYRIDREYLDTGADVPTGGRQVALVQMERHGSVVIVVAVSGSCCEYGFSNVDALGEAELSDFDDLQLAANAIRPGVLQRLGLTGAG